MVNLQLYLRLGFTILILGFLVAAFSIGYKMGLRSSSNPNLIVFTNVTRIYTNIDFNVSNTGDPFFDFYKQLPK